MKKLYKLIFLMITTIITMVISFPAKKLYNAYDINQDVSRDKSMIMLLRESNKNNEHPRLMIRKNDIDRIKTYLEKDSFIIQQYTSLKQKAEDIMREDPVKYYLPDGVRLLSVSRIALYRLQILGLLYNISGEERYAKRGWLELETICDANPDRKNFSFPNWHTEHFLDTAEMTNAAAIGYDWLYNYLDNSQRELVRKTIYTKGIKQALRSYENKEDWTVAENNWIAVCTSGIAMGALAIGGEENQYNDDLERILQISINKMTLFLKKYTTNGGWFEGPNYWDYATTYCAYFIASLDSSLKTDYGITNGTNFSNAGDFLIYITGPNGVFNYGDSQQWKIKTPVMVWLSNKFKKGQYLWYYKNIISPKDSSPLSIVWYSDQVKSESVKQEDMYFSGIEVVTMHTAILKNTDIFLAFKAGRNNVSHSDLDVGTFVYDTLGERWFDDLGNEDYNVSGYWDMGSNGERWKYYRKRAEGHNTLVIDSDNNKPDQNIYAYAKVKKFTSDSQKSIAILDLTSAYLPKVSSVNRTFTLFKDQGKLLIEDSIQSKGYLNINWHSHTSAEVELSVNKKNATLYKNGKKISVRIKCPEDSAFSLEKIGTINKMSNEKKYDGPSCNDLVIRVNSNGDTKIAVEIENM